MGELKSDSSVDEMTADVGATFLSASIFINFSKSTDLRISFSFFTPRFSFSNNYIKRDWKNRKKKQKLAKKTMKIWKSLDEIFITLKNFRFLDFIWCCFRGRDYRVKHDRNRLWIYCGLGRNKSFWCELWLAILKFVFTHLFRVVTASHDRKERSKWIYLEGTYIQRLQSLNESLSSPFAAFNTEMN